MLLHTCRFPMSSTSFTGKKSEVPDVVDADITGYVNDVPRRKQPVFSYSRCPNLTRRGRCR